MSALYEAISTEYVAILKDAREKSADGFTVGECFALLVDAATRLIKVANIFKSYTGEQKKDIVIATCLQLFDAVVPYVKIPYLSTFVPSFVRNYVIAQVRASLPATLSLVIDKVYAALKPLLNPVIPQPSVN